MPTFRGTPRALDTYLEPAVRYTLFAVAAPLVALLWWFEAWWWVPVPLIAAIIAHQWYFRARGDRPSELVLEPSTATLVDRLRGAPISIELDEVSVASLYVRRGRDGEQAVVLLATPLGPQLGVQFTDLRRPSASHVIDIDEADRSLGGQAGILRAVTPLARASRQLFPRPAALDWLLQRIPDPAWARTGLQLWRGMAPHLSPFGYHVADADAWLVLDGDRWTLTHTDGTSEAGTLDALECTSAHRTIEMTMPSEEGPRLEEARVDLLTVSLQGGPIISFPAPVAASQAPQAGLSDQGYHCHAPEGAALVSHLRRVLQASRLPGPLNG